MDVAEEQQKPVFLLSGMAQQVWKFSVIEKLGTQDIGQNLLVIIIIVYFEAILTHMLTLNRDQNYNVTLLLN